jgi:hypothetical protein
MHNFEVHATMRQEGFWFRKHLYPGLPTIQIAQELGRIVRVDEMIPSFAIETVQALRPRTVAEASKNRYSGHFGLGKFPLHTDLAHWALPPRYLFLRCVVGSADVSTNVLRSDTVIAPVGTSILEKALLSARARYGYSGLLRALCQRGDTRVFRWDPLFLKPANKYGQVLATIMLGSEWDAVVKSIVLEQAGDSILIDNWQMLHGRSQIPLQSRDRHIDRIYLSEIFE